VLLAVALTVSGCGASRGGRGGGGGSGSRGGGTGTPAEGEGEGAAEGEGEGPAEGEGEEPTEGEGEGEPLKDACDNDADIATLEEGDIYGTVQGCAFQCIADPEGPCARDCIVGETGLSGDCAQCFGDTVQCALSRCMNECMVDPQGQACVDCRAENCDEAFEECSGLSASGGAPTEPLPD